MNEVIPNGVVQVGSVKPCHHGYSIRWFSIQHEHELKIFLVEFWSGRESKTINSLFLQGLYNIKQRLFFI